MLVQLQRNGQPPLTKSAANNNTEQHNTAQHNTPQHTTTQRNTTQHNTHTHTHRDRATHTYTHTHTHTHPHTHTHTHTQTHIHTHTHRDRERERDRAGCVVALPRVLALLKMWPQASLPVLPAITRDSGSGCCTQAGRVGPRADFGICGHDRGPWILPPAVLDEAGRRSWKKAASASCNLSALSGLS